MPQVVDEMLTQMNVVEASGLNGPKECSGIFSFLVEFKFVSKLNESKFKV